MTEAACEASGAPDFWAQSCPVLAVGPARASHSVSWSVTEPLAARDSHSCLTSCPACRGERPPVLGPSPGSSPVDKLLHLSSSSCD